MFAVAAANPVVVAAAAAAAADLATLQQNLKGLQVQMCTYKGLHGWVVHAIPF